MGVAAQALETEGGNVGGSDGSSRGRSVRLLLTSFPTAEDAPGSTRSAAVADPRSQPELGPLESYRPHG